MMTEVFFNQELSDIMFEVDALEEWKSIATELGFDAQLSLAKGKESPIPYPFMNLVMERVYETLCPRKVSFKEYNKSTIPLEILKQIAYSVKDKHFSDIEIWYDDKTPDPIVVGIHGSFYIRKNSTYGMLKDENGKQLGFDTKELADAYLGGLEDAKDHSSAMEVIGKYIVGRWGDELLDFPSLKKRAVEVFVENEASELKKDISTKTEKLKLITENTTSYFNGNMQKYDVIGRSW